MPEFVHLHLHSEGSLLDGMCRTKPLLERASSLKMPALAITDHGSMYKCIEFYQAARGSGVKPIIGCEIYVTPGSRFDRTGRGGGSNYYHLILLAKNLEGYRNLMRLVSRGHMEGFYYKPRVDRETLAEFSEGLICLSACLGGEVPQLIVQGKLAEARKVAAEHLEIYGRGNYYLELQDHGIQDQYRVNEVLLEMSREMEIPLVATNDVHYVCADDYHAHDLLLCIQTGANITDEKRFRFEGDQFFLRDAEQMARKFGHIPEALSNTLLVAEMCSLDLQFDQSALPEFPVPEGFTCETYLLDLCMKALPGRFNPATETHIARLDYELSVINPKGFAPYFLIVSDFVKYAHEHGISVRARGSAAGSIVAYLLGITSVDPLQYGLMFERFLNPDRVEMPDIDLDFSDVRREEMIDYAIRKYGKDHVAQIGTLGTLGARAAIRDAGRALSVPLPDVDRIAKMIQGLSPSIDSSIESIPDLKRMYEGDPNVKILIDRARSVEGVVRSSGTHAAGVVISREPLTDCTPLQRAGEVKVVRDGKEVVETRACTQYDMGSISKIGLLKVDFLGLRNLTVMDHCVAMIRERKDPDFDVDRVPEDNQKTFDMLCEGHGIGVFQLESSGMRQMIRALKPRVFEDLVPVVALYRPGPLSSGMVDQFIECRHGRKQVTYLDERLEPLLSDTYGVMLYQEQIMQISMQIGGFKPGDAEKLRKAMSKKIAELMNQFRAKFVAGATAKGVGSDIAVTIYDQMANFAAYGFNKAHSAAYGALAYQTAYLKANYSVEYMSALLTSLMENKDRLSGTIEECRRMELDVLPPDVNTSVVDFAPEPGSDTTIRFGLGAIKGLSPTVIGGILAIREEGGPFQSLFDFCERAHSLDSLNRGNLEALIKAGAFQKITPNRKQLLDSLDAALSMRQQARKNAQSGQVSLFGLLGSTADAMAPATPHPTLHDVKEFAPQELLEFEKDLLGLYVSNHPLHGYREFFRKSHVTATADMCHLNDKDPVAIGGLVVEFRNHQTRKGDPMMFVTMEDLAGRLDVVVFKEALARSGALIQKDRVLLIRGKVSVRSGTGSRGRKNGASEESDSSEYSVIADEISEAVGSAQDIDPWVDVDSGPMGVAGAARIAEGWELSDGSVVGYNPFLEPPLEMDDDADDGSVEDTHEGGLQCGVNAAPQNGGVPCSPAVSITTSLFDKPAVPPGINLLQTASESGASPVGQATAQPNLTADPPCTPLAAERQAPSQAEATTVSGALVSEEASSLNSPAPADVQHESQAHLSPPNTVSVGKARVDGEDGAGGESYEPPDDASAPSEDMDFDAILDDVSTIRDIYGVLPEKGKPHIRLYPPVTSPPEPGAKPAQASRTSTHPSASAPVPAATGQTATSSSANSARPSRKVLRIRLGPAQSNRALLDEVARLLQRYSGGPHPVEITVETVDGRRVLRSNGTGGVQPSPDLVRTLRSKCGEQAVTVG